MRRRVLFISHETTLSGAPILLAHLITWLKKHGWEPVVIAPEDGPIAEKLRAEGIEIFFEPRLLTHPASDKVRELMRRADVVVANTIATYQAVHAAYLEHVPLVWYLHENRVALQLMEQIPAMRQALALATALVTPAQSNAEIFRPFTTRPIHVVPHGYPPVVPQHKSPGGPITFLTLATYESRKGQDILLAAIRAIDPAARARALFQMAGRTLETAFHDQLRRDSVSISNVQLVGALDHSSALALLNQADVVVCASRDETMPIVLVEAMSLGKGIISTEVGGVGEWLRDGVNALLVPSCDPVALAAAMTRCISDPALALRLGAAARETFADNFQFDTYGERFSALLDELVAAGRTAGTPDQYHKWIELHETTRRVDQAALRSLSSQPVISILLPVYNPDLPLLAAAIDSVQAQIYQSWELCIADDASTDSGVRPFLEKVAAPEPRVRLCLRETNGHMSACSNSALALATGEWCVLLDQDDMLPADALARVAIETNRHPGAGIIYSDEDKIDLAGNRSNPFFKTEWNPELFFGQNYVGHLGAYRTALLRTISGFREGFEGSQDYDLALRCIEQIAPAQIRHIPEILYHWRMVPGSLADKRDAKPYAKEAARRAIGDHLQRVGIRGRVEACPENIESHRVIYELPEPRPLVAIIIAPAAYGADASYCLASIRRFTSESEAEIISLGGDRQRGRANNRGAAATVAEVLVFLGAEIEVMNGDWLRELVSHASRAEVAAVGARVFHPDGTLEHGGFILGLGGIAGSAHRGVPRGHAGYFNRTFLQRDCAAVSWDCMATRSTVFRDLGGFDETNLTAHYQDIDFCLRARERGLRVIWTPYAEVVNHAPAANVVSPERDAAYMERTWHEQLRADPFYSPNFSLALPGFELAFPPRG